MLWLLSHAGLFRKRVQMHKVTVIGTGSVGATIAYTLAAQLLASEIVLIDINNDKSLGEALDIRQGMPFCGPVKIYAGSYAEAAGSDIVIITSGAARKAGQTRLDLAKINVGIARDLTERVVRYAPNAVYIIVANPVDIMTYAFAKYSGLPDNQIIGSGTILDTARLRARLSEYFEISQQNVHASVFGEHGDSSFVPWSTATIAGVPLDVYAKSEIMQKRGLPELNHAEVEAYIRTSGERVIRRKGATYYAVSLAVCHICKCIFYSTETLLTVSTMLHGEFGISDVCLSVMTEVGKNGHGSIFASPMTDEEILKLQKSADTLKSIIKDVGL